VTAPGCSRLTNSGRHALRYEQRIAMPFHHRGAVVSNSAPSDGGPDSHSAFELVEHSGDIKLRALGTTLEDVFINAACGMMAFMFGDEILNARPERREFVRIEAADREALLVDWLAELLYRAASRYHAYVDFHICTMDDHRLAAEVGIAAAEALDDIKAVTHHELAIRKIDGGFEAVVVFDL
jgi:SHS2 domain-containing protein